MLLFYCPKGDENDGGTDFQFNDSTRSIRSVIRVDAFYYVKKE